MLLPEIEKRRARRALSERPVPQDVVSRIITAATYAPSCSNNQPWRLVVVNRKEELNLARAALSGGNYWAKKAPVIVLVVTREDLDCRLSDRRNYALFDVGLAAENLMLQSFREGLIAHPIAGFDPLALKKEFEIPDDYTVVTCIIIGYSGQEGHLSEKHRRQEKSQRERKEQSEVAVYNRWFDRRSE